jgi:hypothetical protein
METFLLVHVPTLVLGLGIVAVTTGAALLGLLAVRRRVELRTLEAHHDVAGLILAIVGVLYAVLLAFVVVIAWQQLDNSMGAATTEAATVGSIYRETLAFGNRGAEAQQAIRQYAVSVADVEWPTMADHHVESPATDVALNQVWRSLERLGPTTPSQTEFYSNAVTSLQRVSELRRARILMSGDELPLPLWTALIVGAMISIGFTYFFGVRNFRAQALMVAALSSMIGVVLFLILALDLPFTGDISVGPTAMRAVLHELPHYVL